MASIQPRSRLIAPMTANETASSATSDHGSSAILMTSWCFSSPVAPLASHSSTLRPESSVTGGSLLFASEWMGGSSRLCGRRHMHELGKRPEWVSGRNIGDSIFSLIRYSVVGASNQQNSLRYSLFKYDLNLTVPPAFTTRISWR